jgi:hypothetical protein
MVGVVGAGLAIMPALFIQAIFVGNIQRCQQQQELDIAITGAIETTCAEDLADQPEWLPVVVIIGGGIMGTLGGFGYGFVSPAAPPKRFDEGDDTYLPF